MAGMDVDTFEEKLLEQKASTGQQNINSDINVQMTWQTPRWWFNPGHTLKGWVLSSLYHFSLSQNYIQLESYPNQQNFVKLTAMHFCLTNFILVLIPKRNLQLLPWVQ